MTSSGLADVDFIEELRLRRWARENYVAKEQRSQSWHPVVIEEMEKKDVELRDEVPEPIYAYSESKA